MSEMLSNVSIELSFEHECFNSKGSKGRIDDRTIDVIRM